MSALSALGVAPETPSFPAVVGCPLCQKNTLHLFDDIFTDGIWLHCNSCLAHGDIITFGAQIWNISLPAALTKLSETGVISSAEIDRVAGEYTRAVNRLQTAENFWADAEAQIWNHGDDATAVRLRELGVRSEIAETAGLVGVAHPDQVSLLCRALGRASPAGLRKGGPCIVFPYYDLPGRFTGFFLLSGKWKIFVPVSGYRRKKASAGYFMFKALLQPTPKVMRGKQFIMEDPLWVLKEQCRQLRHGWKLLPIVASYCGEDAVSYGTNWTAFGPAARFFQGSVATPELISQAASAGGYVALVSPDSTTRLPTVHYTWHRLASVHSKAEPWHKVLDDTLSAMGELTAYSFATNLTAPYEKLQAFFARYPDYSDSFKNRVLQTVTIAPAAPTRVHKKLTLIEQNNNWFSHTGQLVCNAKIIIEKIVQAEDGKKQYIGTIYQNDWSLPFTDDANRVEKIGLLAYAASVAAPHGKLITFDRSWNKRSHILATQLHQPELVVVSARIGWDSAANVFRFGNYALNNAGEIDQTVPPAQFKDFQPFPEPNPIAPITVRQFLTPEAPNAFVWSVFASVAANLIAPATNKDCTAVAVEPNAFEVAAKLGRALNCQHAQTTNLQRGSAANFVRSQTDDTNWPVFVSSLFDTTLLMLAVTKAHNQPVLAKLPPTGAAIAAGYGWQRLVPQETPAITTDFSALRYVLPAYIQRALRSRLTLTTKHKTLAVAVLHDLHEWLDATYGASFNLPQALRCLMPHDTAHEALLLELHRAIQAGKIDLIPRPRRKDQAKNYFLRRKENWWINRRAVDNYLHASKNIPPNWLTIIDLLVQSGVFNGEEIVHGMPGFLVRADWCEKFGDDLSVIREIG